MSSYNPNRLLPHHLSYYDGSDGIRSTQPHQNEHHQEFLHPVSFVHRILSTHCQMSIYLVAAVGFKPYLTKISINSSYIPKVVDSLPMLVAVVGFGLRYMSLK